MTISRMLSLLKSTRAQSARASEVPARVGMNPVKVKAEAVEVAKLKILCPLANNSMISPETGSIPVQVALSPSYPEPDKPVTTAALFLVGANCEEELSKAYRMISPSSWQERAISVPSQNRPGELQTAETAISK